MIIITFSEILFVVFLAILLGSMLYTNLKEYLKQRRCLHLKYHESRGCDAVCSNCRKNLGFISDVRESNPPGRSVMFTATPRNPDYTHKDDALFAAEAYWVDIPNPASRFQIQIDAYNPESIRYRDIAALGPWKPGEPPKE